MPTLAKVAMIILATLSSSNAQEPERKGPAGSMDKGKMGKRMSMMQMMRDPVHESVALAFALPQLQAELGLSAQQMTQLKEDKQGLLAKGQELSAQISAKQKDLDSSVSANPPKSGDVKQILEQIASLRAQLQFAAFETSEKMKGRLTDQQRAKLTAMTTTEIHQAMMSRMTMRDMAQMMEFISGDGEMMGRGMMGMITGMMMGMATGTMPGMPGASPK